MHDFTIRNQQCLNSSCPLRGQVGAGNVVVHSRKHRRFRCSACRKTWVARVGSFYYRLRVEPQRVQEALQLLNEGLSIRKVAELCEASPTTVHRWKLKRLRMDRHFNSKKYECVL